MPSILSFPQWLLATVKYRMKNYDSIVVFHLVFLKKSIKLDQQFNNKEYLHSL